MESNSESVAPAIAGGDAFTVKDVIRSLTGVRLSCDSAALIGQLRDLEDLKSASAGLQARIAVALEARERRAQHAAGLPAAELGQGVAAQVALARRESPARGSRLLGLAKALVTEMPHTLAALHTGQLNEWRATLLVKETACISAADRSAVDEQLAADPGALAGLGDRALTAAARTASYRLDPHSVVNRASNATTDRHVSLRPAPDTMTYLTALLPAAAGVAIHAALTRHAATQRSTGDTRSRGQIMADDLVERLTCTPGGITGVEIQLIMTDRTLLQGDSEPARLPGYGIVPATWARRTAFTRPAPSPNTTDGTGSAAVPQRTNTGDGEPAFTTWLRRLYTTPGSGDLVAMDSRARIFQPRAPPLHPDPGRHLPHPLLRRPHPPPGPHHRLARERTHQQQQRRRTLRSLQPHQRNTRLDRQTPPRPTTHHRNQHTNRPQLPLHSPATARH